MINIRYHPVASLCILIFLGSCLNTTEKSLVGHYNVLSIDLKDSLRKSINLSLEIKKRKKFSLNKNGITINGTWKAGDNGDLTWFNFYIKEQELQCRVLGKENEKIELINSFDLIDSSITRLSFIRQ